MLDRNTVKLVASEYDVLVVERGEAAVTDAAKKKTEFMVDSDLESLQPR